jgi:hypothetical protein
VVRSVFATIVGLVTIVVLTFLMVVEGPRSVAGWLAVPPDHRQEHVRRVAADCSRAVVGYMTGNLLISVIAGMLTLVVLWVLGVPYSGVAPTLGASGDRASASECQGLIGRVPRRMARASAEEVAACSFSDWSWSYSGGSPASGS